MTLAFDISFNAYIFLFFLISTFHTLPNPPFPITYKNLKLFLPTISSGKLYYCTNYVLSFYSERLGGFLGEFGYDS